MRIATPAKINLTLEILGRRPDRFHELATWMLPVGLYDELSITLSSEAAYETNVTDLGFDQSNLVVRAIRRFESEIDRRAEYRVHLQKKIPIGAGLGGGSSDAAAALLLLNRLYENPVPDLRLLQLAADLGSDVAFFIERRSTWCTGRGEKTAFRDFPSDRWVVLIKPEFGVSTAEAYGLYQKLPMDRRQGATKKTAWGGLRNDLEPPVFRKYLILPEIKTWLENQPEIEIALMSGSGSTMFALVDSSETGEQIKARFSADFGPRFWVQVCRLNPPPEPIAH
jgi:4-diphosphocytidyl-2-C-methyl-D-erythritol kinase